MITSWYAELMQRERERSIRAAHLTRLAARLQACTDPSLFDRLARAVRRAPAAC